MNIFVFCQDFDRPMGGVKKLYRHVDILNACGHSAFLVHEKPGFRCRWFENQTRVVSTASLPAGVIPDCLVFGETLGPALASCARGTRKVILNQNAYYTFAHYSLDPSDLQTPYLDPDLVAAIVVSEDSREYLQYTFPQLTVFRIHYGIDPSLFAWSSEKRRRIAFMPRKNQPELLQVINILKFRGALADFELAPIDGVGEAEAARILKDSLIFLSFGHPEGFSLPPAEAMACGCIVVGYHGLGGKEYFKPDFGFPVPTGDILEFARMVEQVIGMHRQDPQALRDRTARAAEFVRATYSPARETQDVVDVWRELEKRFFAAQASRPQAGPGVG